MKTKDLYLSKSYYNKLAYYNNDLSLGNHTVKIESVSDERVYLDRIVVNNTAITNTNYKVYQTTTSGDVYIGQYSEKDAAIKEAGLYATTYVTDYKGNEIWTNAYKVYQSTSAGKQIFIGRYKELSDAKSKATQYKNSYILDLNSKEIWRGKYEVYQNSTFLGRYYTLDEAKAQANKYDNTVIKDVLNNDKVVWTKPESVTIGYVSTNGANLNVRKTASTSGTVLGKLSNGTKVEIVDKSIQGWYKIKYGSGYGYVSSDYISFTKPNTNATVDITKVGKRLADFNHNGYINNTSPKGQCVWYVRGRAKEKLGHSTFGITGDARYWYGKAPSSSKGTTIKSNSIACMSNSKYGHVIFVEYFDGNNVYFTEANANGDNVVSSDDGVLKKKTLSDFNTYMKKFGTIQGYIYLQ